MKEPACKVLFTLHGRVVRGQGNGKTVGMPTANLEVAHGEQLPPNGVYASLVHVGESVRLGVTNVGYRPSVDDEQRISVETYLLDFDGLLYGQELCVEFYYFLRPTRKMESLDAVRKQVARDEAQVRLLLADMVC